MSSTSKSAHYLLFKCPCTFFLMSFYNIRKGGTSEGNEMLRLVCQCVRGDVMGLGSEVEWEGMGQGGGGVRQRKDLADYLRNKYCL